MEFRPDREGERRKLIHMRVLYAYLGGLEMKLVGIIYLLLVVLSGDIYVREG